MSGSNPVHWYRAWTFVGGSVEVSTRPHRDILLPMQEVLRVDTEDGYFELSEEQAADFIGALTMRLVEIRRRRDERAEAALRAPDACDRAWEARQACPMARCRYGTKGV